MSSHGIARISAAIQHEEGLHIIAHIPDLRFDHPAVVLSRQSYRSLMEKLSA